MFVFHFKRSGGMLQHKLDIPDNVDLVKFSGDDSPQHYFLYAVVHRSGAVIDGGHFWAHVKDLIANNWIMCDDATIKTTSRRPDFSDAYVLFY